MTRENSWTFKVLGLPQTKGSGQPFRRKDGRLGVRNDNPKAKGWERTINAVVQSWPHGVQEGAVDLRLVLLLDRPKSISAKKRPEPIVKPDVDKLLRTILDALTGVIYKDDAQVIDVRVRKEYGNMPGVYGEVLW